MPKGKGKEKGKDKGKGKGKGKEAAGPDSVVRKLFKTYERNCNLSNSVMAPNIRKALKAAIEDDKVVTKFILEPVVGEKEGDLPVLFDPFLMSVRQERYLGIRDLYVWEYPLNFQDIANFGLFVEKPFYKLRLIEFRDCLLEPISIRRFAQALVFCDQLTTLNLDYNEFGDEGTKHLCDGLKNNTTLLSISMCYCDLGVASGQYLGQVVSTTAVRELYLDGNNLECEGTMELIKLCVDQAEFEAFERAEEARRKEEEEALKAQQENENRYNSGTGTDISGDDGGDKSASPDSAKKKKKKKKGKKGKKKKEPPGPPPVGPWIYKLHLADNGIDSLEKMGGVKVRTTHRMTADTFNSIVKLGSGLSKKKKGKKGKKKKK